MNHAPPYKTHWMQPLQEYNGKVMKMIRCKLSSFVDAKLLSSLHASFVSSDVWRNSQMNGGIFSVCQFSCILILIQNGSTSYFVTFPPNTDAWRPSHCDPGMHLRNSQQRLCVIIRWWWRKLQRENRAVISHRRWADVCTCTAGGRTLSTSWSFCAGQMTFNRSDLVRKLNGKRMFLVKLLIQTTTIVHSHSL